MLLYLSFILLSLTLIIRSIMNDKSNKELTNLINNQKIMYDMNQKVNFYKESK